jgi:hypothetical protein
LARLGLELTSIIQEWYQSTETVITKTPMLKFTSRLLLDPT